MLKVNMLFVNFINSLNLAHKHKDKELFFKANKLIINFCDFLQKHGLIFSYQLQTLHNTEYITVILKYYRNTPILAQIKIVATTTLPKTMDARSAQNLFLNQLKTTGLLVLSTTKGIAFLAEAKKNNLGGSVLVEIHIF